VVEMSTLIQWIEYSARRMGMEDEVKSAGRCRDVLACDGGLV